MCELVYDIIIGLLSRSGGMGLHLYIELVGLKVCCGRFFVVMKCYENMYVEWIMVLMNIYLYSNVVNDVCASLMITNVIECKGNVCGQGVF